MRSIFPLLPLLVAAQSMPPVYTMHPYAGSAWTGDGRAATSAVLVQPSGLAADAAGNLYIADARDHRVRCVGRDGTIRTIAGTGAPGLKGDFEPAATSPLNSPYGVAADFQGNLFIADLGNGLVRRVGIDGRISTVAGGGSTLPTAAAAPARSVKLSQPRDVAIDRAGNLYISDFGTNQVYQVTPDGALSVIAGTGQPGAIRGPTAALSAPLSGPAGLATDGLGSLFIADSGNRRVRRLSGGWLSTLLDKSGKEVELGTPTGVAVDSGNRLFIADGGARLAVVWPNGEFLSLGIGGTAVAVSSNSDVFSIVDRQVHRLMGGSSVVVAGGSGGAGDGSNRAEWRFHSPSGMVRDGAGNLYIADTGNGRVRRLSDSGVLTTLTSKFSAPTAVALDVRSRLYVGDRASGSIFRADDAGQLREFVRIEGRGMNVDAMAFDAGGNLFFSDSANHLIRRVARDGTMTVAAGGGTLTGDGFGVLLSLGAPSGLAFDTDGVLWFAEAATGRIRKLQHGRVSTLAGTAFKEPRGLRIDSSGNLYVCDAALHRVFRLNRDGSSVPIAGSGDKGYSGDDELALAGMLNGPLDVSFAAGGEILVLDSGNHRIRLLKPQTIETPPAPPPEPLTMPTLDVAHAATWKVQPIAPGQLAYVRGDRLNDCSVTFGGLPAPVIASAADRATVQVPPALRPGFSEVSATRSNEICGIAPVEIVPAAPGILTSGQGQGQALALNETGEANSVSKPAARASVISLFITGEGGASPTVSAEIGGFHADVIWSGAAPSLPGVYQVNVRMPGGFAPSGIVPVALTVNGVRTQPGVTVVSR